MIRMTLNNPGTEVTLRNARQKLNPRATTPWVSSSAIAP